MFLSFEEAAVHTLTVILSLVVLAVSIVAYRSRRGKRYVALTVAFLFLALSEMVQFVESYWLNAFVFLPILDVHLSHILDMAMLVSFGLALMAK